MVHQSVRNAVDRSRHAGQELAASDEGTGPGEFASGGARPASPVAPRTPSPRREIGRRTLRRPRMRHGAPADSWVDSRGWRGTGVRTAHLQCSHAARGVRRADPHAPACAAGSRRDKARRRRRRCTRQARRRRPRRVGGRARRRASRATLDPKGRRHPEAGAAPVFRASATPRCGFFTNRTPGSARWARTMSGPSALDPSSTTISSNRRRVCANTGRSVASRKRPPL